jgi:hypothetical protein
VELIVQQELFIAHLRERIFAVTLKDHINYYFLAESFIAFCEASIIRKVMAI